MGVFRESFSAIVGILRVTLVIAIGIHFWTEERLLEARHLSRDNKTIVPNSTSLGLLAIDEPSTATTTFYGYYIRREFSGGDGIAPYTCDALFVHKSNDRLFQYLAEMVTQGNNIDSLDMKGDLILTIQLGDLSSQVGRKIISSTNQEPVAVLVRKKVQYGKGAYPCYSFVEILSVS